MIIILAFHLILLIHTFTFSFDKYGHKDLLQPQYCSTCCCYCLLLLSLLRKKEMQKIKISYDFMIILHDQEINGYSLP